ncbi:hypothetical protein I302_108739 [Kwoniella bestiolae CBS 10118]|uniref:Uncharacterized protein n=1 Tax=Kwoniella bestiolae CBS 10118 TaxID=1296100 RepID=A0A1B9FTY9_9TREE|nr:hypothetical protein I302_07876 [Kwoniella bestiolae CBS 10118]OCF22231.1 hypothetical protein I302_07876 [Kwoniella bestiolae CBS 10118]
MIFDLYEIRDYWDRYLSPALKLIIDDLVSQTTGKWLERSRAADSALYERCENQWAFKEEVLEYMEFDQSTQIRQKISEKFISENVSEWRRMGNRATNKAEYPDGKIKWEASVPSCPPSNSVHPTLKLFFGRDDPLVLKGSRIDLPPISYEEIRIRNMSTMLNSDLAWIKEGLSQQILSTFFAEERSRLGPRYIRAKEVSEHIKFLARVETFDKFVSEHAENNLNNAWKDTWESALRLNQDHQPDIQQTLYDVLRVMRADVHIERQTRGEERGTFIRSLGEYEGGGHSREDWIPDKSFLSRI